MLAVDAARQLDPNLKVTDLPQWEKLQVKLGIDFISFVGSESLPEKMKRAFPAKAAKKGKRAAKGSNELTPKEKEISGFIGKGGKSNKEINAHFKMANSSVNTSKMKAKGVLVKKNGKWFQK